jgi:pimeloyl-ACP methyl ester carboxylesterase
MDVTNQFVEVAGQRLETQVIGIRERAPTMVFLHEGLGSIALWGAFPAQLCETLGVNGLVYSRHAYGRSSRLTEPRSADFMHHEAHVVLPAVLVALGIERPIIFGHSDGGSIGLLYAALEHDNPARAAIILAPHLFVEQISIDAISAAKRAYIDSDLRARLKRFHDDVDGAFFGWNDIWLDAAFRDWNIEQDIEGIRCPLLAIQGENDEYGSMRQIDAISERVPQARLVKLAGCRHSPHRDCAPAVIAACSEFLKALPA